MYDCKHLLQLLAVKCMWCAQLLPRLQCSPALAKALARLSSHQHGNSCTALQNCWTMVFEFLDSHEGCRIDDSLKCALVHHARAAMQHACSACI